MQMVGEWIWAQGALDVYVPAAEMGVTFAQEVLVSPSEKKRWRLVMSGLARGVSKKRMR
jgi:hypothetical protein